MWKFLENEKIILASGSPRRNSLLKESGLKFISKPVIIDETLKTELPIPEAVCDLAARKSLEASKNESDCYIIGADTIVVIDNEILGKPADTAQAKLMLSKLSGKTHQVITGFSILHLPDNEIVSDFEVTKVTFYDLSSEEMEDYIATDEPFDKAGAYGIQDKGSLLVEKLDGCFFNVVGLPVSRLRRIMKDFIQKVNNG